jgi:hypothetical protein
VKLIGSKYGIEVRNGEPVIVKVATGEPIPDDEPLILFRARDALALPGALYPYQTLCFADGCTDFHLAGVRNRVLAFEEFHHDHPGRMKQPGITRGL